MLEIDILRNSSQKELGVLRGASKGLGVQKDPGALLAKTICFLVMRGISAHSSLKIVSPVFICFYDKNNFEMIHEFSKCLKEL